MANLNFPLDPVVGMTHTVDGKTWIWNGEAWAFKRTALNGKSAYEIAVENGFVGSEADWLASLKGGLSPGNLTTIIERVTVIVDDLTQDNIDAIEAAKEAVQINRDHVDSVIAGAQDIINQARDTGSAELAANAQEQLERIAEVRATAEAALDAIYNSKQPIADAAATSAQNSATAAVNAGALAQASADEAGSSATAAIGHATRAETAADGAEASRASAQTYAGQASSAASDADGSAAIALEQSGLAAEAATLSGTRAAAAKVSEDSAAASVSAAGAYAESASLDALRAEAKADESSNSAQSAAEHASIAIANATDTAQLAAAAESSRLSAAITAAQLFPSTFDQAVFWTNDASGKTPPNTTRGTFVSPVGVGAVYELAETTITALAPKGYLLLQAGRRYRITARIRQKTLATNGSANAIEVRLRGMDSAFATTTLVSAPLNAVGTSGNTHNLNTTEWITVGAEYVVASGETAVYARPIMTIGGNANGAVVQIQTFRIQDITESTAAGDSARAAAETLATVEARSTDAAQYAAAALASKTEAETAKSAANTSASQSSESAESAEGSAALAESAAQLAAQSKNDAGDSATAAAQSASFAASSATDAEISAAAAQSYLVQAQLGADNQYPTTFVDPTDYEVGGDATVDYVAVDGLNTLQFTNGVGTVHHQLARPLIAGRRYRMTVEVRALQDTSSPSALYISRLNTQTQDGLGDFTTGLNTGVSYHLQSHTLLASEGWVNFSREYEMVPDDKPYVRSFFEARAAGSVIQIRLVTISDITDAYQSGKSAQASAASASSAATSANDAQVAATSAQSFSTQASAARDAASGHATSASTSAGQASLAVQTANDSASLASQYATNSANSATLAGTRATSATNSASQASTKADEAANSATASSGFADAAEAAATNSQGSATSAATSASTATSKASEAGLSATAANTAKTLAETARGQAQTFRNEAATSATNAQGSATTATQQAGVATTAKNDAQTAATASAASASTATTKATEAGASAISANTSRTQAETARGQAETFRNEASSSATGAAGSASAASLSAGTAATYRNEALGYRNTAETHAATASTQATNASAEAASARASASLAVQQGLPTANKNTTFGETPLGVNDVPRYYNGWQGGFSRVISSPDNRYGSGKLLYSDRDPSQNGGVGGVYQDITLTPGWWVVDVDIDAEAGSLVGAGIHFNYSDNSMSPPGGADFHFGGELAVGESTLGSRIVTTKKSFRFTKLFNIGPSTSNTTAGKFYLMAGYLPLSAIPGPVKIYWHKAILRLATDAEIKAQKAFTDVAQALVKISDETTARTSAIDSVGQRTTSLEASRSKGGDNSKILPSDFANKGVYWTSLVNGPTPTAIPDTHFGDHKGNAGGGVGPIAFVVGSNGASIPQIYSRGTLPMINGHTYRVTSKYRVTGPNNVLVRTYFDLRNGDKVTSGYTNISEAATSPASGWVTRSSTYRHGTDTLSNGNGLYLAAAMNWNLPAGSNVEIAQLLLEDITDTADTNAAIQTLSQVLTTDIAAQATRSDGLAVRINATGNLVGNSDFAGGSTAGWNVGNALGVPVTHGLNLAGADWMGGGENNIGITQGPPSGSPHYATWYSPSFAVAALQTVQCHALAASHRCGVYICLVFRDANGTITGSSEIPRQDVSDGGVDLNGWTHIGIMSFTAPAGTVSAYFELRKTDTAPGYDNSYAWFMRPFATVLPAPTTTYLPYSPGSSAPAVAVNAARIEAVNTALVNSQGAQATRVSTLEAQALRTDDSVNVNSSFLRWPLDAPYPTGWVTWGEVQSVERITVANGRVVPRVRSLTGYNGGLMVGAVVYMPGWHVITVEAECVDGTTAGSGVTLHGQININFYTEADDTGFVGHVYKKRRWSKLINITQDLLNITGGVLNTHAMVMWDGFGHGLTYSATDFHYFGVRRATDKEVRTQTIDQQLNGAGGITSRVVTSEGAISTLNGKNRAWLDFDIESGTGRARASLRADGQTGTSNIDFVASKIQLANPANGQVIPALTVENGNVVIHGTLTARTIRAENLVVGTITPTEISDAAMGGFSGSHYYSAVNYYYNSGAWQTVMDIPLLAKHNKAVQGQFNVCTRHIGGRSYAEHRVRIIRDDGLIIWGKNGGAPSNTGSEGWNATYAWFDPAPGINVQRLYTLQLRVLNSSDSMQITDRTAYAQELSRVENQGIYVQPDGSGGGGYDGGSGGGTGGGGGGGTRPGLVEY